MLCGRSLGLGLRGSDGKHEAARSLWKCVRSLDYGLLRIVERTGRGRSWRWGTRSQGVGCVAITSCSAVPCGLNMVLHRVLPVGIGYLLFQRRGKILVDVVES